MGTEGPEPEAPSEFSLGTTPDKKASAAKRSASTPTTKKHDSKAKGRGRGSTTGQKRGRSLSHGGVPSAASTAATEDDTHPGVCGWCFVSATKASVHNGALDQCDIHHNFHAARLQGLSWKQIIEIYQNGSEEIKDEMNDNCTKFQNGGMIAEKPKENARAPW